MSHKTISSISADVKTLNAKLKNVSWTDYEKIEIRKLIFRILLNYNEANVYASGSSFDAINSVIDQLRNIYYKIPETGKPDENTQSNLKFVASMMEPIIDTTTDYVSSSGFNFFNSVYHRYDDIVPKLPIFISKLIDPIKFNQRTYTALLVNATSPKHVSSVYEEIMKRANVDIYSVWTRDEHTDAYVDTTKIKKNLECPLREVKSRNKLFDLTIYFMQDSAITDPPLTDYVAEARRSIAFTRTGGVFIMFAPVWVLTGAFKKDLLGKLSNVELENCDKKTGLCMLRGIKLERISNDIDPAAMKRFTDAIVAMNTTMGTDSIYLPPHEITVDKFSGNIASLSDIQSFQKESSLYTKLFETEGANLLSQRPMIPFSVGQLGMVLTSGYVDGIIEEKDGYAHVVKGMSIQSEIYNVTEDDEKDIRTRTNTKVNRVILSICDPSGSIKQLI